MESKNYKLEEYIGDAVYELVIREVLAIDWNNKPAKRVAYRKICHLTRNDVMGKIAKKIGVQPLFPDNPEPHLGCYANALEVKFHDLYKEGGVEAAKKYFIENILPHYHPEIYLREFEL